MSIPQEGFNETAGFGSNCCRPGFLDRFRGLGSADQVMAVDAVSGATVTSEAVIEAVAGVFE